MADTKAFVDVTDRRVLDKLIPAGSPHYSQIRELVVHIISLVPDDSLDLHYSTLCNTTGFESIDCAEVIKQVIGKGKTE